MSLEPPAKVGKLQSVLRAKAKASPGYRFYLLYDKVYRDDVLAWAYRRCKANGGAAGVDGQTFADIEAYGVERWLSELAQELRGRTYQPAAVRRVWIPKADGKQRPLGIPTIRDRVAQMAFVIVVDPIFDEDLQPEQHAYRARHDAHQAIREVQCWLDRGHTEIVDADLSGYFDTIPHQDLMRCVARRISDRHVLHLVKMWLEVAVEETDERGRKVRTTRNKDEGRGTPQGGVASPLLANLYMRRFLLGWKTQGHQRRLEAYVVNYADDFVICCRPGNGDMAMEAMRQIMGKIKLTINERKTRRCRIPEDTFNFLGFTFGEQVSWNTGGRYISPTPAKKKIQAICEQITQVTSPRTSWQRVDVKVAQLNRMLLGWGNYFRLGYVTRAWQVVQQHACRRLRQWMQRRHGRRGRYRSYPDMQLYEQYGLVNLSRRVRRKSLWAKRT